MTRAAATLGALLLLPGCPHTPVPAEPVEHAGEARTFSDADALVTRARAVNDGYGTMRAVHSVEVEIALGGERTEKRAFRGVLALRRPGLFRLNILGPMGVKLVDMLYASGRVRMVYVARHLRRSSRLPEILESIAGDLRAIYRLDPLPAITRRRVEPTVSVASGRTPLYDVREYRHDEVARQLRIYANTLAIARSEVTDVGGIIRTIRYSDYRTNGELMVPRQIKVALEGSVFYWLTIRVEELALDEELDPELFLVGAAAER